MKITTIGIDLAKAVFQIHGVDERGKVAVRKQFKRAEWRKNIATPMPQKMSSYFANLTCVTQNCTSYYKLGTMKFELLLRISVRYARTKKMLGMGT